MTVYAWGDPRTAKTVVILDSESWWEDAQEQTRMKKQLEKQAEEYREEMERRRQRREAERAEIQRKMEEGETVEIPTMLLDALLDHYRYDYWAVPDKSREIVSVYLGEDQEW